MSLSVRIGVEPVRSVAYTALGAAYIGIGTAMTRPIRMFVLQNLTDVILMFSFNGIDDHMPLPANGYIVLDIATNQTFGQGFFLAEGQRLYVKEVPTVVAPSTGSVYLTTFYGAV